METKVKKKYRQKYVYIGKGNKVITKKRRCLKCDKEKLIAENFRICDPCKAENQYICETEFMVML